MKYNCLRTTALLLAVVVSSATDPLGFSHGAKFGYCTVLTIHGERDLDYRSILSQIVRRYVSPLIA